LCQNVFEKVTNPEVDNSLYFLITTIALTYILKITILSKEICSHPPPKPTKIELDYPIYPIHDPALASFTHRSLRYEDDIEKKVLREGDGYSIPKKLLSLSLSLFFLEVIRTSPFLFILNLVPQVLLPPFSLTIRLTLGLININTSAQHSSAQLKPQKPPW
jgi:hypothetical protein